MSTINSKNVQVGTSGVANQNFTLYQPNTPDGTVRLGVGNSGVTTSDVVTVTNAGNMTVSGVATATTFSGSGASLTALNASNISTGTVPTARLATGTADSTTYLRGDSTWQTISTTPTTAQVLTATAGASVGAVGTYALLFNGPATRAPGDTLAGSSLFYAGCDGNNATATSGTWRLMGRNDNVSNRQSTSVWLRIS